MDRLPNMYTELGAVLAELAGSRGPPVSSSSSTRTGS